MLRRAVQIWLFTVAAIHLVSFVSFNPTLSFGSPTHPDSSIVAAYIAPARSVGPWHQASLEAQGLSLCLPPCALLRRQLLHGHGN